MCSVPLPLAFNRVRAERIRRMFFEHIPPEATEAAYGGLATNARTYRPLDTVTVSVTARLKGDDHCTIRVCDPDQRPYYKSAVALENNRGRVRFLAGGQPGVHYIYLIWPGEQRHSRYVNFRLEGDTTIESGDPDLDNLYPFTREAMLLGRREYATPAGKFVGYISADTWHFDGIWLRDWLYGLPAYRYWETAMMCGLDRFLERQSDDGMIPDGIERDGRTWRVGLESDVEYILVLGVWQTWQATGGDGWMADALPRLERALAYIRSDPKHWDAEHGLIKRQHSCDTWDFDIDGASDKGEGRHVIATCDQSGYVLAFQAMHRMYSYLGQTEEAQRWAEEAEAYRQRANRLLWDGDKFRHHVHLDEISHGDFHESRQLAMGNTWAMTRGMATPEQARSIIDEYRRRHAETGDAYPWWSLQPGYPDHLGYFSQKYCRQGGYANGGLMPWVGGELCRAAFLFGREKYGVELLRAYADHLRRTGGAHVWYWPNGKPGFRTTNEVPYATWGMAEWVNAAIGGLAGVIDDAQRLNAVTVSPRWAAAGVKDVRVVVSYASSRAYFAYRMHVDEEAGQIHLTCTGSGEQVKFNVLLPDGWMPLSANEGGLRMELGVHDVDDSRYACFSMPLSGIRSIVLQCRTGQPTAPHTQKAGANQATGGDA